MRLSLIFFLMVSGATAQSGRMQPGVGRSQSRPGLQPPNRSLQPVPGSRFRSFQTGFGLWPPRSFPRPTLGASPPPPPPPADLPIANLAPSPEGADILMALKSGSIFAVRSYRLEGDAIRYRTIYGGENTAAWSALDLERTQKLNAARGVAFDVH